MKPDKRQTIAGLFAAMAVPRGLFITGTDTGVGKTLVTGAIGRHLSKTWKKVGVFKPIATGCEHRREGLVSRDAEFLGHCADSEQPLTVINPITYSQPLAPWVAAEAAERPIDWEAMAVAYREVAASADVVLVEGVGGVMVPLERDFYVLDLMAAMKLPVVIVCRAGLGTINHTLLTVEVCRRAGLAILGFVINGYEASSDDVAQESNPRVLKELSGLSILGVIPYDEESCVEKATLGEDVMGAIRLTNWAALIEDGSV